MSHTAKKVLVKSVIQALPTYCMEVFKMTQGFCEKYERLIRDFRWRMKAVIGKCIGCHGSK